MHHKERSLGHIFFVKGVLALVAAALSFTGCGLLNPGTNTNNQPTRAATPVIAGKANTTDSSAPQPGGPVLASTEGDKPGIRVEVVELKRTSGDTVNLKFTMINDSDQDMSFGYDFGEGGKTSDISTVAGAHLIDAVGKKKYFVVRDTEGACLCSQNLKDIKPRTRVNLFAKFPAPPADVQRITVVVPHFTPMDDVPISQ